MTIGHKTFTGFEAFSIIADADAFDVLRLGSGGDTVAMRFYRDRAAVPMIHGRAGDDLIIRLRQASGDSVAFGATGDDTITGGGGTGVPDGPWTDRLFGGRGNDMLFLTGVQAVNEGLAKMTAGKGRDLFVLGNGGRFAHAIVTDFAPRADRIVIDRSGGYSIIANDPRGAAAAPGRPEVLRDDAAVLRFGIGFTDVFGVAGTFLLHDDRATGRLTGQVATTGLRIEDYDLLGELAGAPRLTVGHILRLDF